MGAGGGGGVGRGCGLLKTELEAGKPFRSMFRRRVTATGIPARQYSNGI